jgi:hypothetical protein
MLDYSVGARRIDDHGSLAITEDAFNPAEPLRLVIWINAASSRML